MDIGLRWNYWTPYKEKYDRLVNLDLTRLNQGDMQVILPNDTALTSIPGIPSGVIGSWAARGLTTITANAATSRLR